jgi:hypothetical protein
MGTRPPQNCQDGWRSGKKRLKIPKVAWRMVVRALMGN